MGSRVPTAVEIGTALDSMSGLPLVSLAKCVYLNVTLLFASMTHDASTVPIRSQLSPPVPVVRAHARAERIARLEAVRVPVAQVHEQRLATASASACRTLRCACFRTPAAIRSVLAWFCRVTPGGNRRRRSTPCPLKTGPPMFPVNQESSFSYRDALPFLSAGRHAVRSGTGSSARPLNLFEPDRLTESTVKPPERSKSMARAPPFVVVNCAMSCDAGSADSVPNSGSVTFTPSNW